MRKDIGELGLVDNGCMRLDGKLVKRVYQDQLGTNETVFNAIKECSTDLKSIDCLEKCKLEEEARKVEVQGNGKAEFSSGPVPEY
jgi:hypothetical protein